jgi:hypothetical protein
MWQRIQTLFLGLVFVSMLLGIFMPIWVWEDGASGSSHKLFALHYQVMEDGSRSSAYFPYSLTGILMVAAATVAAMQIRRFDNRITQIKMGAFNTLLLLGVMICAVVFSNRLTNEVGYNGTNNIAYWIIFAGVAFNWLALRFIRRDEKLVRDSERLR